MSAHRVLALAFVSLLAACASGPRPLPRGASPEDRLATAEEALLTAKSLVGTFEVTATGAKPMHLKGELTLHGGNALKLTAEGTAGADAVHLELDSTAGVVNRSLLKGKSASNHQEPVGDALAEALLLKLVRLGLMHDLSKLSADEPPDSVTGGVRQWVKAGSPRDAGTRKVGELSCEAVSYTVEITGQEAGSGELCIAEATSLPLAHTVSLHLGVGDVTSTETYSWKTKERSERGALDAQKRPFASSSR